MKKKNLWILAIFATLIIQAQKLEKVKGSKIVVTTERVFDTIKAIELHKNLDITIVKGEENKLLIFADDNLHDIVLTDITNGVLDIDMSNRIIRKKKFEVTLYLTNLEIITLNDVSKVTNNEYFKSNSFVVNLNDRTQANFMIESDSIYIEANDHAKADLLLKGKKVDLNLLESSKIDLGISGESLQLKSNQKSTISIEGKVDSAIIEGTDSAKIKATNFIIQDAIVKTDDNTILNINSIKNITIDASGKSKVYIYGSPKIIIDSFKDNATLFKK